MNGRAWHQSGNYMENLWEKNNIFNLGFLETVSWPFLIIEYDVMTIGVDFYHITTSQLIENLRSKSNDINKDGKDSLTGLKFLVDTGPPW